MILVLVTTGDDYWNCQCSASHTSAMCQGLAAPSDLDPEEGLNVYSDFFASRSGALLWDPDHQGAEDIPIAR